MHYVDNNSSNVESPANTGSQSNFTAQQAGPDSSYDTLTEVNTGGGDTNTTLINGASFESDWSGFTRYEFLLVSKHHSALQWKLFSIF